MDAIKKITETIQGLSYYSESEYPFLVEYWNIASPEELPEKIAALTQSSIDQQRIIADADFFARMTRITDPDDQPIVDNAQKAKELHRQLKEQLEQIKVTRVEGDSQIPIFITGMLRDGGCLVLHTTAIET